MYELMNPGLTFFPKDLAAKILNTDSEGLLPLPGQLITHRFEINLMIHTVTQSDM